MAEQGTLEKLTGRKVKQAPRVSVVIPAFNVAKFIDETLRSVLAQTFDDYEIVVVNDGSHDTADLTLTLADHLESIVYLEQANGGTAAARNTAIEHSRGELIAFLDGDDCWLPDYLKEQIAYLEAHTLDMVYADAFLFGAVRSSAETYMARCPSRGTADFESIVAGTCNVIASGTVVSKRAIVRAGMFDASLPRIGLEDFDLWLRLAKTGARIGYQRKRLLRYRVRTDSLSGNSIQRARRNVIGLNIAREKSALTEREEHVWRAALKQAEAELLLEIGKAQLLRQQFSEARRSFRAANAYFKTSKLVAVDLALTVAPNVLVRLFKKHRASELPFIPMCDLEHLPLPKA